MNVSYIIDSIVRHTTVLIAQVATTAGVRAPLAHVANRVFLDLVNEIERQGVGRKVAADMFGLALRSYQQKVQRLSESATDSGTTLWEAVYAHLREREVSTRGEILMRFRRDEPATVGSILNDLVENGLVYRTGRGENCVFRVTPDEDLVRVPMTSSPEATAAALWFRIYREGPVSLRELAADPKLETEALNRALEQLVVEGRVTCNDGAGEPVYQSSRCVVPLGDEDGWEAALVDHLQMVTSAICTKLRNGKTRALPADELGGASYRFDVWPGHPAEQRVRGLLKKMRADLSELWDEVSAHNELHGKAGRELSRVSFYCGQSLVATSIEADGSNS